jgi:arylsulfatase A-like enzyme
VPGIHVDMYPTFLDITGTAAPANYPLDGESLVPLFKNADASLKRTAIYQHFPGYLGMGADQWRTTPVGLIEAGDWKLMEFFEDGRLELYNLKDDIGEQHNLASAMPDKAKELRDQMIAWRTTVGAKMPEKNTPPAEALPKKKGKGKKKKTAAE